MPLNVTKRLYRNVNTGKLEELTDQRLSVFPDQYEVYEQRDEDCLTCGDIAVDVESDDNELDLEPLFVQEVVADKKDKK